MSELQTLGDIIESGAYLEYPSEDGQWFLGGEEIDMAIYGQIISYPDPACDFFQNEKITIYTLSTWVCHDTPVGINLVVLNDVVVGIIWRKFRRSSDVFRFISEETRALFIEAWEKYRPKPEIADNLVDAGTYGLLLPENPQAEKFHSEWDSGLITLSCESIKDWAEQSQDPTFTSITDASVIQNMIKGVQGAIDYEQSEVDIINQLSPDDYQDNKLAADKYRAEYQQNIDWLNITLMAPLQARLADLSSQDA